MTQMFEVVVKALGEVRNAAGELVGTEEIEATTQLTADQVRELGLHTEGDEQA